MTVDPAFWHGRRVLLTGNTGFKGAWLALWLTRLGADVAGFSAGVLDPRSMHQQARLDELVAWRRGDIRDAAVLEDAVKDAAPEVLIHMAAQSLVRRSFADPRETFETNLLGTLNVLEAARATEGTRVIINVTSDKCYENREHGRPFREEDAKGGVDPYSASKACADLLADAYRRTYFGDGDRSPRLASVRAGNVIGGGDWGADRLVPDLMRGALDRTPVAIRNPGAQRPWQHVLNPLSGYLTLAQRLWDDRGLAGGWNFGPEESATVGAIAERVAARWPGDLELEVDAGPHPPESETLRLDSSKARELLGWAPAWGLDESLEATVGWYTALAQGDDLRTFSETQIDAFAAVPA
jgi:CDP-glucose 4,6-dehydratase